MKSVHRRGTFPLSALLASATIVVISTLVPLGVPVSGAQSITQTKTEIANLSAQLSRQEKSSEVTANAYDAAKSQLQTLTRNIITLQTREREERVVLALTTKSMVKAVVQSYVFGTPTSQTIAVFNQDVTSSDSRSVFESLVVDNLNALRAKLNAQRAQVFAAISQVSTKRAQANVDTANLQNLLASNIAAADQTRTTLGVALGALKTQIIQYEVAAGAAAARVGDTGAETSAVQAASLVGGQTAANTVLAAIAANTPPVVTNLVSGTPAGVGFDCSGLVQWAWGKVGFSIPRTTEEQWAALPHVPLNQLRPGDLLYYYNLDGDNAVDHVVMYVGAGPWGSNTIIAAAYTGTNISLAPIFTAGLRGAARP